MKLTASFAGSLQADMQAELLTDRTGATGTTRTRSLMQRALSTAKRHRSFGEARAVPPGFVEPSRRGGVHGSICQ
jgi:hypothetical protein